MAQNEKPALRLENVGPIIYSRVEFGDLTVIVGPQASGKSIFLETLKLVIDRNQIIEFFGKQNIVFGDDPAAFISGFYGRGMGGMLQNDPEPEVTWSGQKYSLKSLTRKKKGRQRLEEHLFYIPAQRVVSLPSGVSQTFGSFQYGDPYVLRYFANQIHFLLQNEFVRTAKLFPAENRLNSTLRAPIEKHFFGGANLEIDQKEFTKTLSLKVEGLSEGLPFLAWSAGQREFVPLLLGLYWLCPAGKVSRRDSLEWVVIEEPEMGLHPRAISAFLLLVLELMRRGYRVVISTHSTIVLDLVWAMQEIKSNSGQEGDVRQLFSMKATQTSKEIAKSALTKEYRVWFFERGEPAKDISALDPGADDETISSWGDLTGFSSRSAEVVANVVNRAARREVKK